jgi:general secretion pathway protein B
MSYILDALRRADAERERGAVPGLSSQQHAYVEDDASRPQRPRALVWAIVALAGALVVVAVAWNFLGGGSPPPATRPVVEGSVSPAPAPAAPVMLPTTPSVAAPSPEAMTVTSPATAAPTQAAPSQGGEPGPAATPAPAPRAAAKHPPEAKRVARRGVEPEPAPSANENAAQAKGAEPKAARAQGDARVYQQAELPDDVRRDLPKITIGGSSYSGDAASRMVMINGQIFHEGDQLAPQLVLERIKLKSAVLSYKGYRYEVTF